MKALILAAGYSTRLYPLTLNQPKALLPIAGRPMLDYLIDHLETLDDLTHVSIVTNARFYCDFSAWASTAAARLKHLAFEVISDGTTSDQDKLGAVGDMWYAIEKMGLDDDLLVAACDDIFTFKLADFVNDFKSHGCDTLLGKRIDSVDDLKRFAVATLDEDRRVLDLVEKPDVPPTDIAVYALYIYRRDTLPLIGQYLREGGKPDSPGHFPEWLCRRKDVRMYLFEGECIDVGTPQSYREICERYEKGEIARG